MTNEGAPRPWAGSALALVCAGAMLLAGTGAWLTLGVAAVWLGSLWLARPEPQPVVAMADPGEARVAARAALIEPIGIPLLLIDGHVVAMANAAARAALGGHAVGQDARIVLRHPEAVRLLSLADGESVTVPGFSGARSLWQLTRRRIDDALWLIELHDRTAEADLSRAHTDFVANASHELKTPLAAVIGYAETLVDARDTIDPATALRFHETMLREARRMEQLVSDLMSLSEVEAEKHDRPSEVLDLSRLVERVAGEVAALAGRERIALTGPDGAGEASVCVRGDRAQLEQVVRNLIDNALKYGDGTSPVQVRVTTAGPDATVRVADSGAGIAPQHLPLLTRRFYRTDPGRSRAAGGTGLGLAIVKHIVERHRGRLDIASTVGVGTTVTVTLPLVQAAAGSAA